VLSSIPTCQRIKVSTKGDKWRPETQGVMKLGNGRNPALMFGLSGTSSHDRGGGVGGTSEKEDSRALEG